MKKGKANMEIQSVVKLLQLKVQSLKESEVGLVHPDLQAFSEAKISLLEDFIALAPSYMGLEAFRKAISKEVAEVGLSQRISRNSFLIAAMRVKVGILKEVQALLPAPKASTTRAPRKSVMFVSA